MSGSPREKSPKTTPRTSIERSMPLRPTCSTAFRLTIPKTRLQTRAKRAERSRGTEAAATQRRSPTSHARRHDDDAMHMLTDRASRCLGAFQPRTIAIHESSIAHAGFFGFDLPTSTWLEALARTAYDELPRDQSAHEVDIGRNPCLRQKGTDVLGSHSISRTL